MPFVGPDIPAHLLGQKLDNAGDSDNDEGPQPSIGPQIPPELIGTSSKLHDDAAEASDGDDDDDYTPALPPDLVSSQHNNDASSIPSVGSRIGPIGPSLPPGVGGRSRDYEDDDSDEDVGPKPLPAGIKYYELDAVAQFIQKEENRRKNAEEAAKPKALKRDEWMLAPPSSSDLLGTLDPSKLTKPRQFSRSTAPPREVDNSLWTETPAERQQRIADEVSGKKRRAVNADNTLSVEEELELRKKRRMDEEVRRGVEEHTRNVRGPALVDSHGKAPKKDDSESKASAIWEHSRDMGLGGRPMDDASRAKMLKDAKGLGDRFGSGSKGGFL